MKPFTKRTYSFREGTSSEIEKVDGGLNTPLRKIKSRGRTFIGGKTPTIDNTQEASASLLSPFARGSVRLKSIRKRKMANREDTKNDGTSFKREKVADKQKDEIEMKIEDNIRMRDGITKLLGGCHDTRQAMDIGKNLLTINSRMLSLMSSLQKKRSSNILKDHNKGQSLHDKSLDPCVGDLAVSDIRIPLLWKQDAHFKSKAGEQPALLYHMFCLLKINDQVFDTPLFQFSQIDTDVTFNEVFTFRDINSDFKLEVEVYYSVIQNPDNPAWTPIRTPKKSVYSSAPKFCLAAHSQLTIDDVKDGFVVSDFTMGGIGASATAVLGHVDDLPDNPFALWGQFSCQLRARPACFIKQNLDGHLLLQTSNGGQPVWEKYYCRLRKCIVQCWKQNPEKEESFSITPGLSIQLKKGMKLRTEVNVENSGRCLIILTSKESEEKEPVLAFENEEDFETWKKALQQAVLNIKAWKAGNYTSMDIEEFEAKKVAFNKAMNFFDQTMTNVENKQASPILARKVGKNASKTSLYLPEITPKIKSFYDQIDIKEKGDTKDGPSASNEVSKDKKLFHVLSREKYLQDKNEKDAEEPCVVNNDKENVELLAQSEESVVADVKDKENLEQDSKNEDDDDGGKIIRGSSVVLNRVKENETYVESNDNEASSQTSATDERQDDAVLIESHVKDDDENISAEDKSVKEIEEIGPEEPVITDSVADEVKTTEKQIDLESEGERDREAITDPVDQDVGDNSGVEDEPMETEESVLDYFMEAIDSAADLDESSDAALTGENSRDDNDDEKDEYEEEEDGINKKENDNDVEKNENDEEKDYEKKEDNINEKEDDNNEEEDVNNRKDNDVEKDDDDVNNDDGKIEESIDEREDINDAKEVSKDAVKDVTIDVPGSELTNELAEGASSVDGQDSSECVEAYSNEEMSCTENSKETTEENCEENTKDNKIENTADLVEASNDDTVIKENDTDVVLESSEANVESTEISVDANEVKETLPLEEPASAIIEPNDLSAGSSQQTSLLSSDAVDTKSENMNAIAGDSSTRSDTPSETKLPSCGLNGEVSSEGVCSDKESHEECSHKEEIVTLKQIEPLDNGSNESELTSDKSTDEIIAKDTVTESDKIDAGGKIETDV